MIKINYPKTPQKPSIIYLKDLRVGDVVHGQMSCTSLVGLFLRTDTRVIYLDYPCHEWYIPTSAERYFLQGAELVDITVEFKSKSRQDT